jgi:biotin transporter BioY
MAWVAGFAYSDEDNFLDTYFKIFLVSLVVFVPGVIWLKFFTSVSWIHAVQIGFIPFIAGDLVKTGITATALRLARRNNKS